MESIDVVNLSGRLKQESGKIALLDVREPWEYERCHIAGSINIPMSEFTRRTDELPEVDEIVVICHHGARSWQVANYLETSGIDAKIMNLEGGIDAWAIQIEPHMPRY